MSTDPNELLQRARNKDPEALAMVYDTYSPRIYAYIYRHVGDGQRAEDLTSKTFIKMLESLQRDRFATTAIQSWLYRIAHNVIVDDVRYEKRRPTSELYNNLAMPPSSEPESQVSRILANEYIHRAIAKLTDDQRNVIILRFGEGMTAGQAAEVLDKTEEAVRALQRRALVNLRKLISSSE